MAYPFVQGIDYGPRDGTLGLSFHMSEGSDNLVSYLARHAGEDLWEWAHRVSGVSCHVAILSTGKRVQMLDWDHASGNLNPEDRAGEYGYYGHHHLRDVLGSHWPDPNAWTLSAELAGRRAVGPTQAQVESAIEWGHEMRGMFSTLRGATGHHDQSPKGCPGLTPHMKAIFAGVGGHGLWTGDTDMALTKYHADGNEVGGTLVTKRPTDSISFVRLAPRQTVHIESPRPAIGRYILDELEPTRRFYAMDVGGQLRFVDEDDVTFAPSGAAPPVDQTALFNSGVDAAAQAARTARRT